MYSKVTTDMHFNEREKEVLKFWQDNDIVNTARIISPFSTALPPPTASPISAMCLPAPSRI